MRTFRSLLWAGADAHIIASWLNERMRNRLEQVGWWCHVIALLSRSRLMRWETEASDQTKRYLLKTVYTTAVIHHGGAIQE
ncbi:hypothetical protein chiPu_0008114 [Chiloscyllium punctatum]|uniref:Uncharacterized protein n=1 Tax=Chiloscyllium punctatum TaxID=137246 RepID=A0A401SGY1_CHIPU|nr:hypothetical protein [Chiloscyllium punctatum]